jgi:hypothetical protein
MKIDYSVSAFSFTIGGFDCTNYLDSISLRLPMHEPGRILTWKGDFKISRNRAAIRAGLPHDLFDPRQTPGRWRPGQQRVFLSINGHPFPALRIENYRYNKQTGEGEGRLVQVLDLLNGDRPDIPTTGAIVPPRKLQRGALSSVVSGLLARAAGDANIPVIVGGIGAIAGSTETETISRNPVADAQRLMGLSWHWLTVDGNEVIYGLNGNPGVASVAFVRSDRQVEMIPNLDAIQFAAPRVMVVGSTFIPEQLPCAEPAEPEPTADGQGRPTIQRTDTYKPFNEVFDTPGSYSSTPTLAEQKTILYAYQDRRFLNEVLPSELQSDYNAVIGDSFELQPNEPLFTATIKKMPFGSLFPETGTNTSLVIGEAIVETLIARVVFKPSGVLSGNDQSLTLIAANRETLTTSFIPAVPTSSPVEDPNNPGQHTCFEPPPEKEPPQVAPERPLKEIPIIGESLVQYAGWSPVINNPLIENFGFLPNVGVADNLARQIARREERRRDSWLVKMPIPMEWAALGFRPLALCEVGGYRLQMDGVVLSLKPDEASIEFEGGALANSAIEILKIGSRIKIGAKVASYPLVTFPVAAGIGLAARVETRSNTSALSAGIGLAAVVSTSSTISSTTSVSAGVRPAARVVSAPGDRAAGGVSLSAIISTSTV